MLIYAIIMTTYFKKCKAIYLCSLSQYGPRTTHKRHLDPEFSASSSGNLNKRFVIAKVEIMRNLQMQKISNAGRYRF